MPLKLTGLSLNSASDLVLWFRDACVTGRGTLADDQGPSDVLERLWQQASDHPEDQHLVAEAVLEMVGIGPDLVRSEALGWCRYKSHPSLIRGLLYFSDADWLTTDNPRQPGQALGRLLVQAVTTSAGPLDLKQRERLQRLALRFDSFDLLLWHDLREDPDGAGLDTLRRLVSVGGSLDELGLRALAVAYARSPLLPEVENLLRHRPKPLRAAFAHELKRSA